MLGRLVDTSDWSSQEWLAAVLLAFILVTIGVVLRRLAGLWRLSQNRRRTPNLRPLRRRSRGEKPPGRGAEDGFAKPLLLVCLLALCLGGPALFPFASPFSAQSHAIIIRHDVSPSRYEVRASDHPAVFFIEQQGRSRVCAATLIDPQWAITAAHCLEETGLGRRLESGASFEVLVASEPRRIDAARVHPRYDQRSAADVDLALLHFEAPLPFPSPLAVARDPARVGQVLQLLGWGYTGQGLLGRDRDDGKMRQARNRLSAVGARLQFSFDDPRRAGDSPEPLEGMPSLGDSGGPALLEAETGALLVGVVVGELKGAGFSEETQGRYGSIAVYENLQRHLAWIDATIDATIGATTAGPARAESLSTED